MKLAIMSEMRTGSTFVSEVISHTLYDTGYHYLLENVWMSSDEAVVEKCNHGVVKLHHGDYRKVSGLLNKGVKILVTVRDPLDVYLSAVHYVVQWGNRTFTDALAFMEKDEWVTKMTTRMLSFIKNKHPNLEIVIYERLIRYPYITLHSTLDSLEIPYDPIKLHDNCRSFGFERKTGRKIGDERVGAHERNGSIGQWNNCGIREILEKSALSTEYHRLLTKT